MRSVHFVLVFSRCLSFHQQGCSHFLLVLSMYPAFFIGHSNLTLYALFLEISLLPSQFTPLAGYEFVISFFSPYLPILACGYLSHHFILSFLNQHPCLGSICCETAELEGGEHIVNTAPHLSRHQKGIRHKVWFWLKECRKRMRRYDTT